MFELTREILLIHTIFWWLQSNSWFVYISPDTWLKVCFFKIYYTWKFISANKCYVPQRNFQTSLFQYTANWRLARISCVHTFLNAWDLSIWKSTLYYWSQRERKSIFSAFISSLLYAYYSTHRNVASFYQGGFSYARDLLFSHLFRVSIDIIETPSPFFTCV